MDCTLAGSVGRAPVFRPGQMYGGIHLSNTKERLGSAFFNDSCPDCVFLILLCTGKIAAQVFFL